MWPRRNGPCENDEGKMFNCGPSDAPTKYADFRPAVSVTRSSHGGAMYPHHALSLLRGGVSYAVRPCC